MTNGDTNMNVKYFIRSGWSLCVVALVCGVPGFGQDLPTATPEDVGVSSEKTLGGFDVLGGNATLLWRIESPTLWKGDITIVEKEETITANADLAKKSPTEFVYEAAMDNGDTARVVFHKVETERNKKAKE